MSTFVLVAVVVSHLVLGDSVLLVLGSEENLGSPDQVGFVVLCKQH
jgi:hypothetical protein